MDGTISTRHVRTHAMSEFTSIEVRELSAPLSQTNDSCYTHGTLTNEAAPRGRGEVSPSAHTGHA
eukprot:4855819-Prymnesium_polylepis.1